MIATHFTEKTRLYVQLRPDADTLKLLQDMRSEVADGQPVSDGELHMTVVHIGELSRLIAALPKIDSGRIIRAAEVYAKKLERIAARYNDTNFTLRPCGVESFGKSIALAYEPSRTLDELHQRALKGFIDLLISVGVDEPRVFMENDPNLRYALTLRPHVVLVKNAPLNSKLSNEQPGSFSLMKIVY